MQTIRHMYRPYDHRLIAGVAVGVANYIGTNPVLVRAIWVLLTLLGGAGILIYLIAWVIIPDQEGHYSFMPLILALVLIVLPALLALAWLYPVMVTATH